MSTLNVNKSVALYYFNGTSWVPWQGASSPTTSDITPIEPLALYVYNGSSYSPWDGTFSASGGSGGSPSGAAGGDLSGTYPNPTVHQINGAAIPTSQTYVGTDSSGHIVAVPTEAAGTVYAGPASGVAALPAFRSITGSDLPGFGSFYLNSGVVANPSAWSLVNHASSTITKIVLYVAASDATTDLTFDIKKNGTSVLTAPITVVHATASGTINTYTTLTSSPLSLAQNDVMTLVITSGTSAWLGQINLE